MTKMCEACGRTVDEASMIHITRNGVTRSFCDRHEVILRPSGVLEVRDA